MVRGLYTAYTGMINEQKRLDIISNNLANSATVGFKQEGVTNQAFAKELTIKINDASEAFTRRAIGTMSLGVKIGEVYTNFNQGSLRSTENTYDLALEGNGFFAVSVHDRGHSESTMYTREGSFTMTKDGFIVTKDGHNLLGESGPIQVPLDSNVVIDSIGSVYANGQLVDTLSIVDFDDYDYLAKYGETMYQAVNGATPKDATALVHQGFTEQSNVNVVKEMVEMITITRAYEANQKVIQSIDTTLEKAVNAVGRV